MTKLEALRLFAGASLLAMMVGSAADAQTASANTAVASNATNTIGEVVVTARRREENLQNVPQVVNAVSGADLNKLNLTQFQDISSVVPGLTLQGESSSYASQMSLRGVAFNSFGSADPTVAFYINDAPVTNELVFQSMYDLGQVEVLRGPQGTLRGVTAPSGSITVSTRRPDLNEFGAFMNSSATTRSAYNVSAGVNVPLIPGKLAARISGLYDDSHYDHVHSVNNTTDPFSRTKSGRISLLAEPVDFITASVVYQHLGHDQATTPPVESMSLSQPGIANGTGPLLHASNRLGIANQAVQVAETQDFVNTSLAVRFAKQKVEYIFGGTRWVDDVNQPLDLAYLFTSPLPEVVHTLFKEYTHEVRLSSDERLFDMLDYTVGYFHSHTSSFNNINEEGGAPGVLTYNTLVDYQQYRTEESIFGNVTLHLPADTELTAGLRRILSYKSEDLANLSIPQFNIASPLLPPTFGDHSKTIYNISISHRFSSDFMVYATTGSSWRAGPVTLGILRPPTPNLTKFTQIQPETSRSYEVGFKSSWLDKRLLADVSVFHQDFDGYIYYGAPVNYVNIQAGTPMLGTFNFQANVPAKVTGVEALITYIPTRNFNISASFAYANSKIENGVIACNPSGVVTIQSIEAASGGDAVAACNVTQRLTFAPNWSLVLQPEYTRPLSDKMDGFVRGLVSIYPNNPNDPTNPYDSVRSYYSASLFAGLRAPGGAWEASIFAKNIGPGRTLSRGDLPQMTNGLVNAAYGQYVAATYTPPTEYGIQLRYAFGSR